MAGSIRPAAVGLDAREQHDRPEQRKKERADECQDGVQHGLPLAMNGRDEDDPAAKCIAPRG
jgi:hypothetical protein